MCSKLEENIFCIHLHLCVLVPFGCSWNKSLGLKYGDISTIQNLIQHNQKHSTFQLCYQMQRLKEDPAGLSNGCFSKHKWQGSVCFQRHLLVKIHVRCAFAVSNRAQVQKGIQRGELSSLIVSGKAAEFPHWKRKRVLVVN